MASKKVLTHKFLLTSHSGKKILFICTREMKHVGEIGLLPHVTIKTCRNFTAAGLHIGGDVAYLPYNSMTKSTRNEVMRNFKLWCRQTILLSYDFDPQTDKLIDL